MNSFSSSTSNQVTNWANQRREAIDKAKKMKDERKNNITVMEEKELKSSLNIQNVYAHIIYQAMKKTQQVNLKLQFKFNMENYL